MFPSAALSPAEYSRETSAAPWDLDPALLPLLRAIIGDAAAVGGGARLIITAPGEEPRILVGVRGNHHPWRALVHTVLQRGEISAQAGSVAAPVAGTAGRHGILMLHYDPAGDLPGAEELARAYAARVEAALALTSTRLATTQGAVEALLQALGAYDQDTARHAVIVQRLARVLGEAADLSSHARLELEWVALLHDVGKVAVPLSLLQKAGPLTYSEWTLMRQHPANGERIVRTVPALDAVGVAIRHHHERWDGTGYPDRLAGEAIPLPARLVALVDAYEVMLTGRPHRPPLSRDEALDELRRGAGTQFDPALLALLPALAAHDLMAVHGVA